MPIRAWFVASALAFVGTGGCDQGPEPDFQPDPETAASEPERPRTAEGYEVIEAKRKAKDPEPAKHAVRRPTSEDPEGGEFTLAEAAEGLPDKGSLIAGIKTDLGTMKCELYDDKAPITVANFVGLARGKRPWWDAHAAAWVKKPYYDGTTFHRVIPDFMIQGGDALGDGSGDAGYVIPDEVHPSLKHDRKGQLCMANKGANTNSAQFFITDGPAPHLDGGYTIFGQCTPTEVVSKIARVPQTGGPKNRPLTSVTIESVQITREQ